MLHQQYQDNINELLTKIEEAEVIVVGGAAGMSEAAGYSFYQTGPFFLNYFGNFAKEYGITNIFDGFYYPFPTKEERWAYLATQIKSIYDLAPGGPYVDLAKILKGKNFFVVTTNQDTQFTKVFPEEQVAPIQGDLRYFQCAARCHDEIYYNEEQINEMYSQIEGTAIPTALIPQCPSCGGDMEPWVRSFVFLEGKAYMKELIKYNKYLTNNKFKKILFLELGVGQMTPMFIKEPFWNMTYSFPDAYYITVNPKDALLPRELAGKGLAIQEDIARFFQDVVLEKAKREGIHK
ncbi:MAG: NAD-dependent protein deacetylase [Solibacillus sp.]